LDTQYSNLTFGQLGVNVKKVLDEISEIFPGVAIEDLDFEPRKEKAALVAHRDICYRMHQELCLQRSMEQGWKRLLQTMAPSCFRFDGDNLIATEKLLDAAIAAVQVEPDQTCDRYKPGIPPNLETSLAALAYSRWSEGGTNP
jgi:hypothetical protein